MSGWMSKIYFSKQQQTARHRHCFLALVWSTDKSIQSLLDSTLEHQEENVDKHLSYNLYQRVIYLSQGSATAS
jgi:hypothetical protein